MTSSVTGPRPLTSIRVEAFNSASESRGSIHDDEKAREMGYRGGLVPGVTVLASMTRLLREEFGHDWSDGASFHGLIRRPVYEGDMVTVEGEVGEADASGRVALNLRVLDPGGNVCATGTVDAPATMASAR